MAIAPDRLLIAEIESAAVEMARNAGHLVQGYFGRSVEVEFKDAKKTDPVTRADKESQAYLYEAIARRFPGHGIVGEESSDESEAPASDLMWVLDPLDGTTNFLNGLPLYGVSIGVLHRGAPVVGALFLPWPGKAEGVVIHARRQGGSWMDGEAFSLPLSETPEAGRLTGLPGSFAAQFRLGKGLRSRVGEVRMTGSVAYELAMVARGVMQYAVFGGPRIWDVAAGVLIVEEAGGRVLVRRHRNSRWQPMATVGPAWDSGPPSVRALRRWAAPMVAASPQVADFVAANLARRSRLLARAARLLKRSQSRGGSPARPH